MRASLFTQEGRAARSGRKVLLLFVVCWLTVSSLIGYLTFNHYTRPNLPPLQRVYFHQYFSSALRSRLSPFKLSSDYLLLVRIVPNAKTKKDDILICHDREVIPMLDGDGKIQRNKDNLPDIRLKKDFATRLKSYRWDKLRLNDGYANTMLRQHIYEDQEIYQLFYPSLLAGLLIFFPGLTGAFVVKQRMTRRYLLGRTIRGTRELTPKEYARLHRRNKGIGLEVFTHGKGV